MIREISTRYGGKPGGYLWAFIDPVAHIVMMSIIFAAIARAPALGRSFPLFFATGYLPFMFYQSMQSYIAGTVKANKALFNYPIVSPFDAVISRYLVQTMTSFFVAFLVLEVVTLEDGLILTVDYAALFTACASATVLGLAIGAANIALFAKFPVYEQVFGLVMRPMFMVSGAFFLPEGLPHPFSEWILYNPITHVIMWFRVGIYPEYRADGFDAAYVWEFTSICLAVGLLFFTLASKAIREERF